MTLEQCHYIVIEGPIGAGKTTLARHMGEYLNAKLLLETPDAISFLPKFYQDMARYGLATQLAFLFQRVDQVTSLQQVDLFGDITVSDFLFEKDRLFAEIVLSTDEYQLYSHIYQHLRIQAPQPDLVIYLQADTDVLIERIRQRQINYESHISENYLLQLNEHYSRFFYDYNDAPLLIVNTENLNLANNAADFSLLLERINGMRSNREYFNKS